MRRWAPLVVVPAAALVLACGGDDAAPSGPATLAPADAAIYAESVAKPEGEEANALEGALSKALDTDDPGAFITERIDEDLADENAGITFEEDIEPWLGERAALFVEEFTDEGAGAIVIETTDPDAAQEAIDKAAAADEAKEEQAEHEGFEYTVDEDGDAAGIIDDWLVGGTEDGFKAAVEASQGESLADSERFESATERFESDFGGIDEERVATLYLDVAGTIEGVVAAGEIPRAQGEVAKQVLGEAAEEPVLAGLGASEDSLGFDLSVPAADPESAPGASGTELIRSLPGEAWAALGLNDVGEAVRSGLAGLESADLPGLPRGGISEAIRRQTGLDLDDAVSWIGDVALFVEGTNFLDLGGGAVVETTDPDASARAIATVEGILRRELRGEAEVGPLDLEGGGEGFSIQPPGAPDQFHVVQRDDRIVAVFGDEAAEQAFEPSEELGGSEAFERAEDMLGGDFEPTGFVQLDTVFQLAEAGGASDDPNYAAAKPFLEHLDFLAFGGRPAEDRSLLRSTVGLE